MPAYEFVADGLVVERVVTLDGDYEDTRLGLAAMERQPGSSGWRLVGTVDPEPPRQGPDPEHPARDPQTAHATATRPATKARTRAAEET